MKIYLTKSAYDDIRNAQRFYELQKPGLGEYFQDSIFTEIDSLLIYAGTHPIHCGHYRMLTGKFPYSIYYKIINEAVVVKAVLDCRSNPLRIKNKLK